MKRITSFFLIALCLILANNLYAQCQVTLSNTSNGTKVWTHAKEKIYLNGDLENGILTAFIQLIVLQDPNDDDLVQFLMIVDAGAKGSKRLVVPRQVSIVFSDGEVLSLQAESLEPPKMISGAYMQAGNFILKGVMFNRFQTSSIKSIEIIDNRENLKLTCYPYLDILKEQANCIGLKL